MDKRWRNAGLHTLLGFVTIAISVGYFGEVGQSNQTWSYSHFLSSVEDKKITQVEINSELTQAQFTNPEDSSLITVNLPRDSYQLRVLLISLRTNGVDYTFLPESNEGFWLDILSALFVPILLLVGLFFLLRRAQSGPGSQVMNFGKSKAIKFNSLNCGDRTCSLPEKLPISV